VEWRVLPKTRSSMVLSLAVVLISRDSSLLYKMLVPNRQRAIIALPKVIRLGKGPYCRNSCGTVSRAKERSAKCLQMPIYGLCPHSRNWIFRARDSFSRRSGRASRQITCNIWRQPGTTVAVVAAAADRKKPAHSRKCIAGPVRHVGQQEMRLPQT
jgi:hypothetical protein